MHSRNWGTERRVCAALGQSRGLQRRKKIRPDDETALTTDIIRLASQYGQYGYKRVERIWRQEGQSTCKTQEERQILSE